MKGRGKVRGILLPPLLEHFTHRVLCHYPGGQQAPSIWLYAEKTAQHNIVREFEQSKAEQNSSAGPSTTAAAAIDGNRINF